MDDATKESLSKKLLERLNTSHNWDVDKAQEASDKIVLNAEDIITEAGIPDPDNELAEDLAQTILWCPEHFERNK